MTHGERPSGPRSEDVQEHDAAYVAESQLNLGRVLKEVADSIDDSEFNQDVLERWCGIAFGLWEDGDSLEDIAMQLREELISPTPPEEQDEDTAVLSTSWAEDRGNQEDFVVLVTSIVAQAVEAE